MTTTPGGTLFLTRNDISGLMEFNDYVVAVEEVFRLYADGKASLPGVVDIDANDGAFHIKSASAELKGKYVAVKVNGNFPQNKKRYGLPTIQGVILLYDGETGYPLAIMDSIEITIQRTGAATILAAKYLARPDSTVVTICGCGNQGRISLVGLKQILPLQKAYAYDLDPQTAATFGEAMTIKLGVPVIPAANHADGTRQSDVVVTCTPSRRAFLLKGDIKPGTFIAAVGADSHDKQELDPRLMSSSKIVADIIEQCARIGELHHAIAEGSLMKTDVHAELSEIIAGRKPGRISSEEIIIFDSTGTALQDVAAASAVYEKAMSKSIGTFFKLA
jgi:ornithine cyclodeaminase/alanine dehydrogenase